MTIGAGFSSHPYKIHYTALKAKVMEVGQEIVPDPENVIAWQVQDVGLTVHGNVNIVIIEITIEKATTEKEVGQESENRGNRENSENLEIIDAKKSTMTMEAGVAAANTSTVPENLARDGKQVIPDLKEETIWNAEALELATKIENLVKDQDIDRKKKAPTTTMLKSL